MSKYILAIDQGTTGSTVIIFDKSGAIVSRAYSEFRQIYPKPGWVEHDATEIWDTTVLVIKKALANAAAASKDIAAIGITNQRETTVMWDRHTGIPIHHAIVWQCRRTSALCNQLKADRLESTFMHKTGLVIDAYFSGTKIRWLLDNVNSAREKAQNGDLLFGTIDAWLLWKLTGGMVHATDYTNASRTLIYNIYDKKWDEDLLAILNIPATILPDVQPSSHIYGYTAIPELFETDIPIAGMAGDQQAALYGQNCWKPGMVKNTYGTGCFMLLIAGHKAIHSKNRLLTTLACHADGTPCYALEGAIFMAGAVVQWLRDELQLIAKASDSESIALSVSDNNNVYLVPAFVGLGAPHWDMDARGAILGLTRGANRAHIVRAALESIAFQTYDVLQAMIKDAGLAITEIRVDGGATANNFLMQFQADILGIAIDRPEITETTALGAAFLAGRAVNFWQNAAELEKIRKTDKRFQPTMDETQKTALLDGWAKAVWRIKS
ncbi:glycerol kinase GlpK [candidate division KSB1 bacterium]|nr:glycerol kinase GlpK [candidate division KSB1 bacterium]